MMIMNDVTRAEFDRRISEVARQYLAEVISSGHDSTKASMFYDEMYNIAQLAESIKRESEKAIDPD